MKSPKYCSHLPKIFYYPLHIIATAREKKHNNNFLNISLY